MFHFFVLPEENNIQISTAFLPKELHGNKMILFAISLLYNLGNKINFETYAIDLVGGFYNKLLSLGAEETEVYDALKITNQVATKINDLFVKTNPDLLNQ